MWFIVLGHLVLQVKDPDHRLPPDIVSGAYFLQIVCTLEGVFTTLYLGFMWLLIRF